MSPVFPWRSAPAADFAVIGDPVGHSLSPRMHMAAYAALGLSFRYVAIHVLPGEVGDALDHLKASGYTGVNVTVPHKEEVLQWASQVEALAARVRAANTIDLRSGACINTDAPGFLDTLHDFPPPRKSALMLGAGGSARALAVALVSDGFELRIYNRTHSRAVWLANEVGAEAVEVPDPTDVGLVLNTTSASLKGAELPIAWNLVPQDAVAYELMYSPEPTPFLAAATRHGQRTIDGLPMLVAQGARSFEWWLSIPAPKVAMFEAIR